MIFELVFLILIFGVGELLYLCFGDIENWFLHKFMCIFVAWLFAIFIWVIPYSYSYGLPAESFLSLFLKDDVNSEVYGLIFFLWYYGSLIGIFLFFYLNKLLLKRVRKEEKE